MDFFPDLASGLATILMLGLFIIPGILLVVGVICFLVEVIRIRK